MLARTTGLVHRHVERAPIRQRMVSNPMKLNRTSAASRLLCAKTPFYLSAVLGERTAIRASLRPPQGNAARFLHREAFRGRLPPLQFALLYLRREYPKGIYRGRSPPYVPIDLLSATVLQSSSLQAARRRWPWWRA